MKVRQGRKLKPLLKKKLDEGIKSLIIRKKTSRRGKGYNSAEKYYLKKNIKKVSELRKKVSDLKNNEMKF